MVACISSVLWANTVLKHQDAVLSRVKHNLTYNACMELGNTPINRAQQFFQTDLVTKADEKPICALHDEAIWKVVSFEKWPP